MDTTTTNVVIAVASALSKKEKSAITRAATAHKLAVYADGRTLVQVATELQGETDRIVANGTTKQANAALARLEVAKFGLGRRVFACLRTKALVSKALGGAVGMPQASRTLKKLFDDGYKAALQGNGSSSEGANFDGYNFRVVFRLFFDGKMDVSLVISQNSAEIAKIEVIKVVKSKALDTLRSEVRKVLFPSLAAMAEVVA